MKDIFVCKPCPTGPEKYGIFSTCLCIKALQHWSVEIEEIPGHTETLVNFETVFQIVKHNYFDSDAPRLEQIQYCKELKKPIL